MACFLLTLPALVAILLGLAYLNRTHLPAPRISDNESFNEKARWLRRHLQPGSAPDVLVIGSSMALNNISGSVLEQVLAVKGVVNAGSWGLTTEMTSLVFKELIQQQKPRLVVLSLYHGDFHSERPPEVNWDEFRATFHIKHEWLLYWRSPDVWYYLKTFVDQAENQGLGRKSYHSLDYDLDGSVVLDAEGFQRSEARWNQFKGKIFKDSDVSPQAMAGLAAIAQEARNLGIALCVVVCPLRPEAEQTFAPEGRAELWRRVREIVEASHGVFINPTKSLDLTDDDFADYCHLNRRGAEKFNTAWATELRARSIVTQ